MPRSEGQPTRIGSSLVPGSLLLLILVAFALVSEFNVGRSYGWDEGVYLASARAVIRGAPLFEEVFSSQPPMFLEILAGAFRLFGDTGEVGARVSLAFALLTLACVSWIAWRLLGAVAMPIAALGLLSKLFFDQAITVEAEMPALGFVVLALAILCPPGGRSSAALGLAGVCFALGVLCKLWVAPYVLPVVLLLVLDPESGANGGWRLAWRGASNALRRLLVFGLAALLVVVVVMGRYDLSSFYDQTVRLHWVARRTGVEVWGRVGLDVLQRFARVESCLLVLALAGFVALAWKNPLAALWLGLWAIGSALFLLEHTPIFYRHVLLMAPPLALLAAASARGAAALAGKPRVEAVVGAALGVLLILRPSVTSAALNLPVGTQLPAGFTPDPAQDELIQLIRELSRPGDLVVSDAPIQVFLANRDIPPRLVDASGTRILTGHLTADDAATFTRGARLVILWVNRLDRLPGYRDWVRAHYRRVRKWPGAEWRRELYVAKEAGPGPTPAQLPDP
jgi:4-amino-4-deoxy-L-arabinose transferase-like glycosyltransferase